MTHIFSVALRYCTCCRWITHHRG